MQEFLMRSPLAEELERSRTGYLATFRQMLRQRHGT
jgi:hypothetical protein